MPFDRKFEALAQEVVRKRIMLDEAEADYKAACEKIAALIPEGQKYVTKDGETITHAKSSVRYSPVVEAIQGFLTGKRLRIWRAVRIDAIDMKKLNGFIDAGELDRAVLVENGCLTETPVKSGIRVNFPSTKSLVA